MESFFSSLNVERVHHMQTRKQAKANEFDYVKWFYNPYRRQWQPSAAWAARVLLLPGISTIFPLAMPRPQNPG